MKNYQLKIYFLITVSAVFFSSCVVSKKKFTDSETRRIACEEQNDRLMTVISRLAADTVDFGTRYRSLEREKRELEVTTSAELQNLNKSLRNKETQLTEKEKLLAERENRVRELQALISRQEQLVKDLRNKIANALVGFANDELSVEIKNGKVYVSLSEKLLFPSGSTAVEPKGRDALSRLGEVLSKNTDVDIMIEGHTDNVQIRKGSRFEDNWDLSVLRATSIVRILTSSGVDPVRVIPSGRSEYFPVAGNETSEGKAKNRRTEIILSPKLDEILKILEGN